MPIDDYTTAAGGSLRLKGVKGSKITKHKKKWAKNPEEAEKQRSPPVDPENETGARSQEPDEPVEEAAARISQVDEDVRGDRDGSEEEDRARPRGKTEAELRHEERRRRRLEERLKREGTKTHKERVEEFNHYLSNLSEHHDMPRIGPG
ncbi:MAG: hypothetical protein Q9219_000796 [cf. Caloplaca sp. 3 TL-2023]